jgi:hypothetical protein
MCVLFWLEKRGAILTQIEMGYIGWRAHLKTALYRSLRTSLSKLDWYVWGE